MTLVMGALGIALCCGLSPVAIILGYIELKRIKRGESAAAGKTITLAGLIMGIVGLLLGIIVIGILCAIAVPNFLMAQTRSKTSRTKAELRSLATASEAYFVDNNTYPDSISQLTSPIAYINPGLHDPFSTEQKESYFYWAGPENTYPKSYFIVAGRGSDKELGTKGDTSVLKKYTPEKGIVESGIIEYDPTNGLVSYGDIIRTGSNDTSVTTPGSGVNPSDQ